jgi:hypothetical protein
VVKGPDGWPGMLSSGPLRVSLSRIALSGVCSMTKHQRYVKGLVLPNYDIAPIHLNMCGRSHGVSSLLRHHPPALNRLTKTHGSSMDVILCK